jgi:RNA polymerase sigma-70 factor (ECF subfamily)
MFLGDINKNDASSLFNEYYQPLCRYAEYLNIGEHDAEDIVVNVFHKLLLQPDKFKKAENIKAFLYTTTRNACFDHLKNLKKEKESTELLAYLNEGDTTGIDRLQIKAELLEKIHNAIEELPEKYKVVMQALMNGTKTNELANEMGINVQSVLNIKSRAIKTLRIKLLDEGLPVLVLLYWLFRD